MLQRVCRQSKVNPPLQPPRCKQPIHFPWNLRRRMSWHVYRLHSTSPCRLWWFTSHFTPLLAYSHCVRLPLVGMGFFAHCIHEKEYRTQESKGYQRIDDVYVVSLPSKKILTYKRCFFIVPTVRTKQDGEIRIKAIE